MKFVLWCLQVLWKSYIDFEIEQEEFGNTRNLYKRLLQRTQHVKVRTSLQTKTPPSRRRPRRFLHPPLLPPPPQVWISYAKFELSVDEAERLQNCRQIYEEANKSLRSCEEKEERLMLLESWRDFEKEFGSEATMEKVRKLMPKKVKKRRKLTAEDGVRTCSSSSTSCLLTVTLPPLFSSRPLLLPEAQIRFKDKFTRLKWLKDDTNCTWPDLTNILILIHMISLININLTF